MKPRGLAGRVSNFYDKNRRFKPYRPPISNPLNSSVHQTAFKNFKIRTKSNVVNAMINFTNRKGHLYRGNEGVWDVLTFNKLTKQYSPSL